MKDTKEYYTVSEIEEFFKDWKDKPHGLLFEEYVYKTHKGFSSGDTVKRNWSDTPINIFGFFRSDRIYCIYSSAYGRGWTTFNEIEKI